MSGSTVKELRKMHEESTKALEEQNQILLSLNVIKNEMVGSTQIDKCHDDIMSEFSKTQMQILNLNNEMSRRQIELLSQLEYLNRIRWWQFWR